MDAALEYVVPIATLLVLLLLVWRLHGLVSRSLEDSSDAPSGDLLQLLERVGKLEVEVQTLRAANETLSEQLESWYRKLTGRAAYSKKEAAQMELMEAADTAGDGAGKSPARRRLKKRRR